jgi:hypothetical protein
MIEQYGLGRRQAPDENDLRYLMSARVPEVVTRDSRYWSTRGWWGDQDGEPKCVAFAWDHWLEDGPMTHVRAPAPIVDPHFLYAEAQKIDEWPGEGYDGTSVRAGAKVLQRLGYIHRYEWAFDVETVVRALLEVGPVVVGTNWYDSMFEPSADGLVSVRGRVVGGHAYKLDGANRRTAIVRAKNSWGRGWGRRGFFALTFEDLDRLIREDGEACLAVELRA